MRQSTNSTIEILLLMVILSQFSLGQTTFAPPGQRYCLRFYGNQIAVAPLDSLLNLGGAFTMECWLYLEAASPFSMIMGKAYDPRSMPPNFHYALVFSDSTKVQFVQSTGQPGTYQSALAPLYLPLKTWNHVAGTLDKGIMRLFINGDSVAAAISSGPPQRSIPVPFAIGGGAQLSGMTDGFSGALRQVRVWDRALNSSQLKANAVKYLSGNEDGLIASWPLDDGAGQSIRNQTSAQMNLQLGTTSKRDIQDPRWIRVNILETGPYFSLEKNNVPANSPSHDGRLIDFDSNGYLDLVVNDWQSPPATAPVFAFRNNGQGLFVDATSDILGTQNIQMNHPRHYAIADFNNDGRLDLFIADHGADIPPFAGGQSRILIQTPDGKLKDETTSRIPVVKAFTHNVSAGDIDGDGDVDLYMCNICCGVGPRLYLNDGTGKFTADSSRIPNLITKGDLGFTSSIFIDVDKDGDLDLVLGGGVDPRIPRDIILLNDGRGFFSLAPETAMPQRYGGLGWLTVAIASADFDNDGWPDLIMSTTGDYDKPRIQLLLNNRDGTFRDATDQIPQSWDRGWIIWIFPADFNNDGLIDFVTRGGGGGEVQVALYLNEGNAQFVNASDLLPFAPAFSPMILPGDLDNDGDIDLFYALGGTGYYTARNLKPYAVPAFTKPTITSFSPTIAAAGTVVNILGSNFAGTVEVNFNGKSANFVFVSENEIKATVPPGASSGRIEITTLAGSVRSSSIFIVPLVIYTFSPSSGPIGTSVALLGSSFIGTTSVKFGGVNASSFSVVADSQIVARVPTNALSGPISITTPSGTISSSKNFIVIHPPDQKYALHFNGNQIALAPLAPQLNLGNAFTMEAWVYFEPAGPYSIFLGKPHDPRGSDPFMSYVLGFSGNGKRIEFVQTTGQPGSYRSATAPTDFPSTTWTHVAATLDGSTMRLYVDGNMVASQASPGPPLNTTIPFGVGAVANKDGFIVDGGFKGALRQVRVWNAALSDSALAVNSSRYLAGNDSGLVAYWPLDDSTGQVGRDLGPNRLNLTLGTTPNVDTNDPTWVLLNSLVSANEDEHLFPLEFRLEQNYPNPFNSGTIIRYQLPRASHVSIRIFNLLGQEVATLVNENKSAGHHQLEWTSNLASGVYFYRIEAGAFVGVKKMLILR
jgi:hypothetical protein